MTSVWKVDKTVRGYNPLTANVRALLQWARVITALPPTALDLSDWLNVGEDRAHPLAWLALDPWFQCDGWSIHFNGAGYGYPELAGRSKNENPGRSLGVYLFPGLVGFALEVHRLIQRLIDEDFYDVHKNVLIGVHPDQVVVRINELLAAVLLDAYSANCRSEG